MHLLDNYAQTFLAINQVRSDTQKEQFKVTAVSLVNNKFNITVQNTGPIPVNITRLWVQNTTTTNWVAKYQINSAVSPARTLSNIGMSIPLSAISTKAYDMKLVTSRGNAQEFFVGSASSAPILLQLFVLPQTVPNGFSATALLSVTNNMSNTAVLTNVVPVMNIISGGATASCSNPQPTSSSAIQPGSTGLFQWACTISGSAYSSVSFNATIQNAYQGNFVISTVTVGQVPTAGASQTSLLAQGLSALGFPDDQLVLHLETITKGVSGYEMHSVPADAPGAVIQVDTTSPAFYTNNDTGMSAVTINPGKWNATLEYLSSPVPPSLLSNRPDMIFHFNNGATLTDSSGYNNAMSLGSPGPTLNTSCTRDGSACYIFSGSQYLTVARNPSITGGGNTMGVYPQTTAGWFNTNTLPSTKGIIYRIEGATTYWEIAMLSTGQISFSFETASGDINTCTSPSGTSFANGIWHHFVAVRDKANECILYMDGTQSAIQNYGGNPADPIVTTTSVYIGKAPSGTAYAFTGSIDDIMHWNSYALTSSQITDLYNANYGTAVHKIAFTLNIVDQNGAFIQFVNQTNISNYPLPFHDSFGAYYNNPPASNTWKSDNFTVSVPQTTVSPGQRLKFQMTFVPQSSGQLNMKFEIDNSLMSANSLIQIPPQNNPLPGFYTLSVSNPQVAVYNKGPYQAWLTFNSRVVLESLDGTQAYGSWVSSFLDNNHKPVNDSPLIPLGGSTPFAFTAPCTKPGVFNGGGGGGTCLGSSNVGQTYRMYVHLEGYDQKGNFLVGTQYFGPVKLTS